jgi:FtsP/CotA-like multicopper oxidase with cupredoxin domain
MDKVRPEVAGLTERVFTIRQQYLVPWVPGPYQLSINYQVAAAPTFPDPIIQMKPNEKQFWRVVNATIQDFTPLQVQFNGVPQKLQLIALDGYPLAKPRYETTILVPPAGRAEFVVQAPPQDNEAIFISLGYSTGPTGNPDIQQELAKIQVSSDANETEATKQETASGTEPAPRISMESLKFADLAKQKPTTLRKIYFSEEFGGTNGPIQFYITVDGQKQKVFEANEKPVIVTKVGAVEDWIVENRALETHAFHIHQIHFMLMEVDGKPVPPDLRDTYEVPFWEGPGHPYHSFKGRFDFRDPTIAGTFVFHCHILLHEDLGMMHKILVEK